MASETSWEFRRFFEEFHGFLWTFAFSLGALQGPHREGATGLPASGARQVQRSSRGLPSALRAPPSGSASASASPGFWLGSAWVSAGFSWAFGLISVWISVGFGLRLDFDLILAWLDLGFGLILF